MSHRLADIFSNILGLFPEEDGRFGPPDWLGSAKYESTSIYEMSHMIGWSHENRDSGAD